MKWRKTMAAILALVMTLQSVPALAAETEEPEELMTEEEYLPEAPESQAQLLFPGDLFYKPYPEATYELIYVERADGTLEIRNYTGTAQGELRLPESINGKPVTSIGGAAFSGGSGFTGSLIIPDSVTNIGRFAFQGCSGLTGELKFPKNLTTINENVFRCCRSLTGSLTIPDSVTSIGSEAFQDCSGFTGSLTIGSGVTSIGEKAFSHCEGFTGSLSIGSGVTSIEDRAFEDCTGFTGSLTIPDSVTNIGEWAFCDCTGFTGDLTIGSGVTNIGRWGFSGCSGFTGSLTIGSGVTSIGYRAFFDCSSLTGSLTIPDSVMSIGSEAFQDCSGFTGSLTIGSGVTSIEDNAFYNCSGFTGSLTIPDSVTSIGYEAFRDCSSLTGSLTIGSGVTSIEGSAFYGCSGFTGSLTIPDSVTSIGNSAFFYCSGFTGDLTIGSGVTSIGDSAFENCSGFTGSLTIGSGVMSIRDNAFSGCSGFTGSLTIPDSVTNIGEWAFCNCSGFTGSLTIGSGVTSIGKHAFENCSGFTGSLTIGSGVTSIGKHAFENCSGFTGSLTIGSGVKTIGSSTFSNCSGFTGSLTIGSGVTSIGHWAFSGCSGFTGELTIPEGVTSIGSYAFADSRELTGAYFMGNAPSDLYEASYSYPSFDPSLPLYYKKGKTGWTDSPDYDAAEGTWKGYSLHLWTGFVVPEINVPEGQYTIRVVTDQKVPIAGAAVTWDGTMEMTDRDGLVSFPKITMGEPVITVRKTGYQDWSNRNSCWTKSDENYETIILYDVSAGPCRLSYAAYSNAKDMSLSVDLLTRTKKVSIGTKAPVTGDLDFSTFYLQCGVEDDKAVRGYAVVQNGKQIAQSRNGFFTLQTDRFSEGSKCAVRVTAADGTQVDTPINLVFSQDHVSKATELSLKDNAVTFRVGDNVPFVGGMDFKISIPLNVPVRFSAAENGKYQLGINLNLAGGKTNAEMIDEAKGLMEDLRNVNAYDLGHMGSKDRRELKKLVQKSNKFSFFKNGSVDFIGYGEWDAGSSVATGEIALFASIEPLRYGFNTVVVFVPVTVDVGLKAGINAVSEIKYDWEHATFECGLDLNPYGKLKAFGGFGMGRAASAGAYGEAKLEADWRLFGTNPGVKKVDLTGQLGVMAYFAFMEFRKPFAYHTWHLYTANSVKTMSTENGAGAQLFDADAYTPMNLDYLELQGPWMGSQAQLLATDARMQLQILQEQVFRNGQPVMTAGPDGLYAAYVNTDAAARAPRVQLTKYNGSTWSDPVTVRADAVLDGSPALYFDGKILRLAYTRTKPGYDPDSLLSFAQNQQVVVGTVDPGTLTFTEERVYEGGFLQVPQFVDQNGTPTLVWLDSTVASEDDALFAPAANISYAEYTGSWSKSQILHEVDLPVRAMTPGCPDGVLAAACVLDTDRNSWTYADQSIYSCSSSGRTLLQGGCRGSVTWGTLPGMAEPAFLWNDEDLLRSSLGTELKAPGLTADYRILGNRLYYSAPGEDAANLTVMAYENGRWSAPITLTGDNRYLERLSMAAWNNHDYVLGLSTFATITENDVDDAKNLVFGLVQPVSDLILDDVDCSLDNLVPGAAVPVTLAIVNGGDHAVSSVDLYVDGVKKRTEVCTILPGDMAELDVNLTCPTAAKSFEISVMETGNEDYTVENNKKSLTLGLADVSVEAEYEQIGSKRSVVAVVENHGVSPASGTVQFRTADGQLLTEGLYEQLRPGEVKLLYWELDENKLQYAPCDIDVRAVCSTADAVAHNNGTGIFLPEREILAEIEGIAVAGRQISVKLTSVIPGATVLCALYDGQGRMIGLQTAPANQKTVTFEAGSGAYDRVFLTNGSHSPVGEAWHIRLF